MKVHLTTLGCPKNQVDSELMLGMLTEAGFPLTTEPEEAECLIVNTCAFIDRAREESVNTILELARLRETGRCRALIVTGCLTQRYGGEVMGAMPEVDAILVSQDTLAYGRDLPGGGDIGDLLLALGQTRMPWIRPMYLHPAHVSDRLIAKWRRARIVPYLDLPVQHGDDGILKSMRRAVTAGRMTEVVAAFRDAIPGLTVRTTVLVGFPGESEAAFQHLLEFLDTVRFDRLGVFTYSPEEGTPSPAFPDQVPAEVAAERAAIVQEFQDRIAWEGNAKLVGTVTDVLVDGPSEDPAFAFEGRTAGQAPEIDGVVYLRGRFEPGRFARVSIAEVEGYELVGERA